MLDAGLNEGEIILTYVCIDIARVGIVVQMDLKLAGSSGGRSSSRRAGPVSRLGREFGWLNRRRLLMGRSASMRMLMRMLMGMCVRVVSVMRMWVLRVVRAGVLWVVGMRMLCLMRVRMLWIVRMRT